MLRKGTEGGGVMVSVPEAARILGLAYQTTYALVRKGERGDPAGLKAEWAGTGWGIKLAELERLMSFRAACPFLTMKRGVRRRRGSAPSTTAHGTTGGAR